MLKIGKIVRPWGIKGLCVSSIVSHIPAKCYIITDGQYIGVHFKHQSSKRYVVYVSDIDSYEAAEKIRDYPIYIDQESVERKNNELYFFDFLDCAIYNKTGENIDNVIDVHDFGAGRVLELNSGMMIPFQDEHVILMDVCNKKIIIDCDKLEDIFI